METEFRSKETIVSPVAIDGVADDGMGDAGEMASDLMGSSRAKVNLDPRVAAGRVTPDSERELKLLTTNERSDRSDLLFSPAEGFFDDSLAR